ncbi:hypothetical protein GGR54DRAFT_636598 [Hypoxylon sp. NC1633]|nr:hypothetical protein GGR54DRAFT_636598 [Hypoxylon sp. NC1633]
MSQRKIPLLNPYSVLGISDDADATVIKSNYRRLCLQYHPDKAGPQSHDKFVQIQEAYELLSDKKLRSRYDNIVKKPRFREAGAGSRASSTSNHWWKKKDEGYSREDNERDGYDHRKRPESESEPQPSWYEKGSSKTPPNNFDVKFPSRTAAVKAMDKVSEDLRALEAGFNTLRERLAKFAHKSEGALRSLLRLISYDIEWKKPGLLSELAQQAEEFRKYQWKNNQEFQNNLPLLYRLQEAVARMKTELPNLEARVTSLELVVEREDKRRLKRRLRMQESQLKTGGRHEHR